MSECFNTKRLSPSRMGKYAECGLQFQKHYIDGEPPGAFSSAALFGSVVHAAREVWITDRSQPLTPLMEAAWKRETADEPVIAAFISEYQALSRRAITLEADIRAKRPDIVAPRRTKDWKESKVAKDTARMLARWIPRLDSESRYRFTANDPLPALYDESLTLAFKYQERYKHLPPAIVSEFAFEMEWEGFTLIGKIDEVGMLLDRDTGEMLGYSIEDAKTYKQEPHVQRDARQLTMYDIAAREYVARGILDLDLEKYPLYPCIDLMRLLEKRYYPEVTDLDRARFLREAQMYERGVTAGVFLPAAKSCRADFCDYAASCAFHHGNQGRTVELNVA